MRTGLLLGSVGTVLGVFAVLTDFWVPTLGAILGAAAVGLGFAARRRRESQLANTVGGIALGLGLVAIVLVIAVIVVFSDF